MKIGIIGTGSVGGAIATTIVPLELVGEIVLIDTDAKRLRSAEADLSHAAAFGRGVKIVAGKYSYLKDADIVIIAAGANQKIGESRTNLAARNAAVMHDVVPKIMKAADRKKIIIIVVSNPLDTMTMIAQKISGLPFGRVIGTGTMLDSARLRAEIARHFDISPQAVDAYVLGEHGDSAVLNWTSAKIGGLSLSDFANQTRTAWTAKIKSEIERRVKASAMEIIQGRGATWDGIAAATTDLIRAIDNDERRVLPVSVTDGKCAFSMPHIVGRHGAGPTLCPPMDAFERRALAESVKAIRKTSYEL